MIFLLPLIILAAANPCPYCKWGYCEFTEGHLANCSACYDLAALVPLVVPATSINQALSPVGVCQLCPDHCSSCEYALLSPAHSWPIPAINCTNCAQRYVNSYFNGSCLACSEHCMECQCVFNSCSATTCLTCDPGYSINYTSNFAVCVPNSRRLQDTQEQRDDKEEKKVFALWIVTVVLFIGAYLSLKLRRKRMSSIILETKEEKTPFQGPVEQAMVK